MWEKGLVENVMWGKGVGRKRQNTVILGEGVKNCSKKIVTYLNVLKVIEPVTQLFINSRKLVLHSLVVLQEAYPGSYIPLK